MTLLVLHAVAALFMTGLVWFVQIVHYPLMHAVGNTGFTGYENEHTRRTGPLVAPVMLFELATGVWLTIAPPEGVSFSWLLANMGLLALIWASTLFLQMPAHRSLERAFSARQIDHLISTNWIRTGAWSLRCLLLIVLLSKSVTLLPTTTASQPPAPVSQTLP